MLRAWLAALAVSPALGYVDRGILKLDNITFDRLIDGSRPVFVRFDKEYSYGEKHEAWKDFAKTVGESSAPLLSCDVGVSEYGDKDNADLAERFGISGQDFPQFRLWTKGSPSIVEPLKYTGAIKADGLLRFVQEKAGVWVGLPGQVRWPSGGCPCGTGRQWPICPRVPAGCRTAFFALRRP
jgi:endoplasmic reticulum protein 29